MGEWVTSYVAPQKELYYRDWLARRAIGSYVVLSRYYTKPFRNRKPVQRWKPTFSGYVFVHMADNIDALIATEFDGFLYFLRDVKGNCCISGETIDDLVHKQSKGYFDITQGNGIPKGLKEGLKVRFQQGYLKGTFGKIEKIGGGKLFLTVKGRSIILPLARAGELSYGSQLDEVDDAVLCS